MSEAETGSAKLFHKTEMDGLQLSEEIAIFTKRDSNGNPRSFPKFIEASAGEQTAYFKTRPNEAGQGDSLFVAHGVFPSKTDRTEVTWKKASAWRFHLWSIGNSGLKQLGLVALVFGLIVLLIDGALAIGKALPLILVPESWIVGSMIVSLFLKGLGLFLLFWKGLLGH